MKPIDLTRIFTKYPGYFVALSRDMRKYLGKGHTPEEAISEARKKGVKQPVLTKVPEEPASYIL